MPDNALWEDFEVNVQGQSDMDQDGKDYDVPEMKQSYACREATSIIHQDLNGHRRRRNRKFDMGA